MELVFFGFSSHWSFTQIVVGSLFSTYPLPYLLLTDKPYLFVSIKISVEISKMFLDERGFFFAVFNVFNVSNESLLFSGQKGALLPV